jgi:outer membrane protein insertion porin family
VQYEFVKISGVPDNEILDLKKEEGNSARRKIYGTFRRDSRDDLFVPKRGVVIDLNSEYFGGFLGGDENFVKAQASWSTYQSLKKDFVSATRFRIGWAKAFAETESVPIDEALFLGGANTIRGFSEKSLGPLDSNEVAVGATYTLVFNQEFRWKTFQILSYVPLLRDLFSSIPLWQSVFFDLGNGFRHTSDVKFDALAYGYGTGFQFISPAGPIRIDYARRIPTERIEFDSRWHFTILYAF